jgi:hypothetical protein
MVLQGLFPTLSGQLAPRWRVEVGGWGRREVSPETTEIDANGGSYRYASTSTCIVLPLLVGFSLFPHLRHGRVEALAGFVRFHTRTQTQLSYTPAGQPLRPLAPSSSSEYDDGPLLLGFGATYELTRHWSVRIEASANWSFMSSLLSTAPIAGPLLGSPAMGAGCTTRLPSPGDRNTSGKLSNPPKKDRGCCRTWRCVGLPCPRSF